MNNNGMEIQTINEQMSNFALNGGDKCCKNTFWAQDGFFNKNLEIKFGHDHNTFYILPLYT